MKKILIFSSCEYSLNNKGDQAMLEGVILWLRSHYPDCKITAYEMVPGALSSMSYISAFPSPESYFLDISQVNENSSLSRARVVLRGLGFACMFLLYKSTGLRLLKESKITGFFHQIMQADALVFSGGGYLNGVWWHDGMYSKIFPALIARMSGVPVILTSQGLGPFANRIDKVLAKLLFSISSLIGVRDGERSFAIVKELANSRIGRTINTGDDALMVQPASTDEVDAALRDAGVPMATQLIAVNLRDSSSYKTGYKKPPFQTVAQVLDELLDDRSDRHIVFVPISYHREDGDSESARQIIKCMKHKDRVSSIVKEYSPSVLKGIVLRSWTAIGTSYHFLLFALSQDIPVYALYQDIYYKQKLEGLCSMYSQEKHCLDIANVTVQDLLDKIKLLLENREEIVKNLRERNRLLQEEFLTAHSAIAAVIAANKAMSQKKIS